MTRRLLAPRWLGLHAVALALIVSFVLLGFWQLGRAEAFGRPAPGFDRAPVAVQSLSKPQEQLPPSSVGRQVMAEGSFDAARTFVVTDRQLRGVPGYWVVGLLRLADGSGICVLRGWSPGAPTTGRVPAPAVGPVLVTGRLQPSEPSDVGQTTPLPPGQLSELNPVSLLSSVPYPLHDGYLALSSQRPADAAGLTLVPVPRGGSSVPGFYLQHVAYVGLWWLFALFTLWFWLRLMRDDLREEGPPTVDAGGAGAVAGQRTGVRTSGPPAAG
jgi:cytochrome oxidase assembly protein ShyY1